MQVTWSLSTGTAQEQLAFDIHTTYDEAGNKGFTFYQFVPKLGGFYHNAGTFPTVAEGKQAIQLSLFNEENK